MPEYTSRLGLVLPADAEDADIEAINSNMRTIDSAIGLHVCTSTTRPTGSNLYIGLQIYETDTKMIRMYTGEAAPYTWMLVNYSGSLRKYAVGTGDLTLTAAMQPIPGVQIDDIPVGYYKVTFGSRLSASSSGTPVVIARLFWNAAQITSAVASGARLLNMGFGNVQFSLEVAAGTKQETRSNAVFLEVTASSPGSAYLSLRAQTTIIGGTQVITGDQSYIHIEPIDKPFDDTGALP